MNKTPFQKLYSYAAKSFHYAPVREVKNAIRPIKHALFGRNGIYKAITIAGSREAMAL